MIKKIIITSLVLMQFSLNYAQRTELLFAFDVKEDSTMSDSCLYSKRFFDQDAHLIKQQWFDGCADSTRYSIWKYKDDKIVYKEFGDPNSSVVYRPVHRSYGLYQYIATDTVTQWPYRIIFYFDEQNLIREEWLNADGTGYANSPRIDHTEISPSHRQEVYFNIESRPVEIRDFLYDGDNNLAEIQFRKVGEKKPFRIVKVFPDE